MSPWRVSSSRSIRRRPMKPVAPVTKYDIGRRAYYAPAPAPPRPSPPAKRAAPAAPSSKTSGPAAASRASPSASGIPSPSLAAGQPQARRERLDGLQVGAGAEGDATGPGEHERARLVFGLEAQVGLVQRLRGRSVDGVAPVLAVDRDHRGAPAALVAHRAGFAHALRSATSPLASERRRRSTCARPCALPCACRTAAAACSS